MNKTPDKYFKVDSWSVVEEGYDPKRSRFSESIFSLSNEFMGVRGYFEEGYSGDHLLGSYFGGLYETKKIGHPQVFKGFVNEESFIVNSVDWLFARIRTKKEQMDLAKSKFSDFVRRVDMKTGALSREFVWYVGGQNRIKIKFERFLSMANNNLGCQRISAEAIDSPVDIEICVGLDFSTIHEIAAGWDMNNVNGSTGEKPLDRFWNVIKKSALNGIYAIEGKTKRTQFSAFSSFQIKCNETVEPETIEKDQFVGCTFNANLQIGKPVVLDKIVLNFWERPKFMTAEQVWQKGMVLAKDNVNTSYDKALKEHSKYWKKKWADLDIEISGDEELQQGIRFDLFQFHMAYHGGDPRIGISSKGLTAEVYSGWCFWVMEAYCQHVYLFTDPAISRNLLQFRYNCLQGAIERAKQVDCDGARYPFCTIDGSESCATWQHADMEIHVGLAIYYAIWLYTKHTGDKEFLYKEGIEMLLQISRFYASRGGWSPTRKDFGFYGVMGPDEYHTLVNHSCYTNLMAKKLFNYTLEVINEMGRKVPDKLQEVKKKVKLADTEPKAWKQMADNMRILQNQMTGVYEQHDGYFDLPEIDVQNITEDEIPIYKHWAYEKLFRINMIKQADVLLLPVWFSSEWTDEEKRANFDFYEPRTIHESSFSPPIHQILAAELGKMDLAYEFFHLMARMDLDNYNRNTAQGLHVTPKSGSWLCVVYGYAGMRTDNEMLEFAPKIPKEWSYYKFRIMHKNSLLEIKVTDEKASFTKLSGPDNVVIKVYGQAIQINSAPVEIELDFRSAPISAR